MLMGVALCMLVSSVIGDRRRHGKVLSPTPRNRLAPMATKVVAAARSLPPFVTNHKIARLSVRMRLKGKCRAADSP